MGEICLYKHQILTEKGNVFNFTVGASQVTTSNKVANTYFIIIRFHGQTIEVKTSNDQLRWYKSNNYNLFYE